MTQAEAETRGDTARPANSAIPSFVSTIVVLGALLMAMGAVIALVHPAMLVSPDAAITGAVRVYAGYLVSRNLAVAVLLLAALGLRARGMLNTLVLLTACIQVLDAGLDCWEGRWAIAPGVTVLGALLLVAAWRLSGYPFWKIAAWRQG
jgi:hypothetical protein